MGYPDGYYYGQGRIICDTSTFSVGDTIRVRSMTDSSKVWNQQVATVGTALVFTVPPYDYYKICTVQDIGGVATEVGGEYRSIDYGQTVFTNLIDTSSLRGIKNIVNAHLHNTYMSIGDEITVKSNGVNYVFQDAGHDLYSSNEVIFVCKNLYAESVQFAPTVATYNVSNLKTVIDSFYSGMTDEDKACLDEMTRESSGTSSWYSYSAKVWTPSNKEVLNSYPFTVPMPVIEQHQFPIFVTQANRIKTYNGTGKTWFTQDYKYSTSAPYQICCINSSGVSVYSDYNSSACALPCFRIKADS